MDPNNPAEGVFKRPPGRPKGSLGRPKGEAVATSAVGRLRQAVGRAFTPNDLEKMLRALSPGEAARILASIEPKAKDDTGPNVFNLIISGLPGRCPECGATINSEKEGGA